MKTLKESEDTMAALLVRTGQRCLLVPAAVVKAARTSSAAV